MLIPANIPILQLLLLYSGFSADPMKLVQYHPPASAGDSDEATPQEKTKSPSDGRTSSWDQIRITVPSVTRKKAGSGRESPQIPKLQRRMSSKLLLSKKFLKKTSSPTPPPLVILDPELPITSVLSKLTMPRLSQVTFHGHLKHRQDVRQVLLEEQKRLQALPHLLAQTTACGVCTLKDLIIPPSQKPSFDQPFGQKVRTAKNHARTKARKPIRLFFLFLIRIPSTMQSLAYCPT